jgi:hypothetical protein
MTTRLATLGLAALLLAAGCSGSSKLPKTYPVHGKVVYADGTPLAGGLVQFQPEGHDELKTTGVTGADGSFSLSTTRDNERADGAIEGPHKVIILPPLAQDQHAPKGLPPQPVQLRETFTVKPDGPNTFTLTVPPGR